MSTPPPRTPRTLVRWLPWVAGALVVLIGGAWLALRAAFPPERVRAVVQEQLSRRLERDVRFAGASLGLWPPVRLSIEALEIAEPGGFGRGAALRFGRIGLVLDPWQLFARRIVVRSLDLDRPALHLVLGDAGHTNLDGLGGPPDTARRGAAMDFDVRRLTVRGGQVLIDDLEAGRRIAFAVDSRLAFGTTARATRFATEGETRIRGLAFGPTTVARAADLNRALADLEWKIDHRGAFDATQKRLALERLELELGRAELSLAGVADLAGPVRFDLRARGASIDVDQVLDYLAKAEAGPLAGVRGKGRLGFDLAVTGGVGGGLRPLVAGTLALRDGAMQYPGAPAGIDRLSFDARLGRDSLRVSNFTARVAGQPVRGWLTMTGAERPVAQFALAGQIDLATVERMIAPRETELAGKVALDVRGAGPVRDPGAIVLEGRARLAGVSVHSPALPKAIDRVDGAIDFSQAHARLHNLSVAAGKSSFVLAGDVARPLALAAKPGEVAPARVSFTLRSPHLDLEELLPAGPGGPMLPNATGSGDVSIDRFKNRKLEATRVAAHLEFQPGIVDVRRFSLGAYGGRISGTAQLDLRDSARPVVTLDARADSIAADLALGAWTRAGGILHGGLDTEIQLSARGVEPRDVLRTLSAQGVASMAQGRLGPLPALERLASFTRIPSLNAVALRDLRMPFKVENGRVVTGPARFGGSHGEWLVTGAVGFDGTLDYAASVTLPPDVVQRLGARAALAAGALADEQGRVILDLKITGPAKAPRISWDEAAMRDRLAGRFSRLIEDQRAKIERQLLDTLASGRRAVEDSARAAGARSRRALEDSLKRQAKDLLEGFFNKGRRDTARTP